MGTDVVNGDNIEEKELMKAKMFHYTSCGLRNVWLKNGFTVKETPYGEASSIHNIEGLHRAIGLYLVTHKPHLSGTEVRFLRKELDMSQAHLGRVLGVGESSVRGWENHRTKITRPAERLLRTLYREHVNGDGTIREMVERLSEINRDVYRKIIELQETPSGWETAA